MLALALALSLAFTTPTEQAKLSPVQAGKVVDVANYCREPEPLRFAVQESVSGPADEQDDTHRGMRFLAAMTELMTVPEGRTGLPLCSRLPVPARAIALFPVLEPVPVSATEQVEIWAAWWAEAGGKLYITVVARRGDI